MTRLMVVSLVVAAWASVASAAPSPLEQYVTNVQAKPAEADKYLGDCDVIVTPGGEARKPCKLTVTDLAGTDKDVALKVKKVKTNRFPKSVLEWTEADVEVRVAKKLTRTLHVYELYSDEPGGGLHAFVWTKLVTDKDALALAKAGKIATPKLTAGAQPPIQELKGQDKTDRTQGVDEALNWLSREGDIKSQLADDAKRGAIIFGSAPSQKYTGASGAKTLAAWKMDLAWNGAPMGGGTPLVQWAYTQAAAKAMDKDKTAITYGAFAVQVQRMTGGGSFAPSPALYIFTIAQ